MTSRSEPVPLIDPTDTAALLSALGDSGGGRSFESLVRPMLGLIAELTSLEAVYLTRIDWDDDQQLIQLSLNRDPDSIEIPEGLVVPWQETLCELSLATGSGWQADVPTAWAERAVGLDLPIESYVSVPVLAGVTDQRPYGTLCAVSRTRREPDPRVVDLLELFASLITTALERDRALAMARARAEVAEQRLEGRIRFAASVEHAMRTPLAVILGWVNSLAERPDEESLRTIALESIGRTATRLSDQVADLLAEARSAVGTGPTENVDVRVLARGLWAVVEDHPYEVRGELHLWTDAVAMSVLLEHLVENAATHTPVGTPVRVLLSPGQLVVEDDGPGLPDRDDLFDPFVSADPVNPGTGLGLHIISAIAGRLGGELVAGASDSGGARFTVTFPDALLVDPARANRS